MKTWLKVSDEYERLQLIEEGVIRAHMFSFDPLSDIQAEYDRAAEIEALDEQVTVIKGE